MAEPKMKDVCAVCGRRYGLHQLIGDSCPKRGKRWEYLPTRFKAIHAKRTKQQSAAGDADK